jgi:anaerobic selenocysteine-containing dehydrogenase
MGEPVIKRGLCGMCRSQCAIRATVTDGKITKLEADTDSPRGRLCPRGALAQSVIYGADRILHPLIRTGARGEASFRQASWDEALDLAADKFRKICADSGPQALASYFGQGVLEDTIGKAGDDFFAHLGSPNDMDCGSICNVVSSRMGPITTLGISRWYLEADIEHSDAVFVWGKNPVTDDGPAFTHRKLLDAQKRGAKIVVIDPRRRGMGEFADLWVPVTPGSDGALALAMLKQIVAQKKYDREMAEDYSSGFPALCEYLDSLTLSSLLNACGVSASMLAELVELFCSTTKISLVSYTGLEYQLSGVQNIRAIFLLWALTGKLDTEGGLYFDGEHLPTCRFHRCDNAIPPVGAREFPLFTAFTGKGQFACLPRAVLEDLPYAVRGLLIAGGSPAVTYPDSETWRRAYEKLDCLVVLDRYMTEDAKYADVIFPVTTWYENASVLDLFDGLQLRKPLIAPVGEARNDIYVLRGLAERLGFGDALPGDDEALYLWALDGDRDLLRRLESAKDCRVKTETPLPRRYRKYRDGLLREDGKKGFPTPSGKIEIFSSVLEEFGYEGLPVYHDFRALPGMGGYPLMMTSGARGKIRIGSFGQNIPEMAKFEPFPAVEISRPDAAESGIGDGDEVWVVSPFGRKKFRAAVCEIAPGAVHIPFGGGSSFMDRAWAEGNVNDLCSLNYHDPISGFVTIKSVPCRVERAE